ncbi:MAG TPA: hypothetical protein VFT45_00550 [Longimicrobium sp.]|nr:hypothetical protein [Longimicrobium sp.]
MRIFLLCWMLILAPAACGAPAAGPPPSGTAVLPRDLAGCYELHRTKSLYFAPPRLRLDSTAVSDALRGFIRDSAWALARLDAEGRPIIDDRRQPILYWGKHPASDSVRIMIHTGYSGSELIIAPRPGADTLHGRAMEHWDMGPSHNSAGTVALVRIPCIEPG